MSESNSRAISQEEFIRRVRETSPTVEILGTYINISTKIKVKCLKCGHIWEAYPSNLYNGHGCPRCAGNAHKTQAEFVNELAEKNPDVEVLGEYMEAHTKIEVKCRKCGYIWFCTPDHLLRGRSCPVCSGHQALSGYNDLTTVNPKLAAEWHPTKNDGLTPEQITAGSGKKVWWVCPKCGHVWEASIAHRNKGEGCPKCNAEKQTSFPEQAILFYLGQITAVENRLELNNQYEIDVYLPEMQVAIEYDGDYWHTNLESQDREKRKNEYLNQMGIRLIRVKEIPEKQVIPADTEDTIYCKYDPSYNYLKGAIDRLGLLLCLPALPDVNIERDRTTIWGQYINAAKDDSLANVLPELAKQWHLTKNKNLTPDNVTISSGKKVWWVCPECGHEWEATINDRSRGKGCPKCANRIPKTQDDFINELSEKNPKVEVLGEYVSANTNIKVRCRICGYIWSSIPSSLLSGYGCPRCAGNAHKTQAEFVNELAEKNPDVEVLGEYMEAHTKIEVKCRKCGYIWSSTPDALIHGHACPHCGGTMLKTQDDFIKELAEKNPTIEVIGKYINARTAIKVKCRKCGHTWPVNPDNLLHGHGCPCCAGNARKTQDEFIKELAEKNPTVEVIGKYVNTNTKIKIRCRKCGHIWSAVPYSLLTGCACPQCKAIATGQRSSKSVRCIETREIFPSATAAAKWNDHKSCSSITACCRGEQKTAAGYHWEYITEPK